MIILTLRTVIFKISANRGWNVQNTNIYADVVKLADTLDLGSSARACRFKSCHPYQTAYAVFYFLRTCRKFHLRANFVCNLHLCS